MTVRKIVDDALNSRFRTKRNAEVARWLYGRLRTKGTGALAKSIRSRAKGHLKLDSLMTYVGHLRRSDKQPTWWRNNREAAELLAIEIDLPLEDLLEGVPDRDRSIDCPDFPGLPPSSLDDRPCALWPEGWLSDIALGVIQDQGERRWIVAPPGWGKTLLVRWFAATSDGAITTASVPTLTAAGAHSSSELPLVIEVECSSPKDAQAADALLGRRASTVVLAPFPPPSSTAGFAWNIRTLPPGLAWRDRLIGWVDRRLEVGDRDTKFDPKAVRDWLERHDPTGALVSSPGDLLALCADFDREAGDATLADRADRWVERFGFRRVDGQARKWGDRHGLAAMAAVASRHFSSIDHRFGPAAGVAWEEAVPAHVSPGSGESDVPGSMVAVGYLRDSGLLRGEGAGLSPFPRWVHHGLLRRGLGVLFAKGNAEAWGAMAADESRQSVVDAALDELAGPDLDALVRKVAERADPASIAATAAVEATFAAASRRLRDPGFEVELRHLGSWQGLATLQMRTLVACRGHHAGLHRPFTRRSLAGWILDAWRFSLRITAPAKRPDPTFAWSFPGWFTPLALTDAPKLPCPNDFKGMEMDLAPLLHEVVEAMRSGPVPADSLQLLAPAFLAAKSDRDWRLGASHLAALGAGTWDPTMLAPVFDATPADRWPAVARRIWGLCAQAMALPSAGHSSFAVTDRIAYLMTKHPLLVRRVLEHLDWRTLEEAITSGGFFGDQAHTALLRSLPRPMLRRAIAAWPKRPLEYAHRWLEAQAIAALLDADDSDLALEVIRNADLSTSAEFVGRLWRIAPELALTEAVGAMNDDLPSAAAWFDHAPREALPALADAVEKKATTPNWLAAWAYNRALEAGAAQEKLFRWARASVHGG